MKTALIIAGSDPGAGAGLLQDLKTATLLGTYGLTVTTALTVQNSEGVHAVHPVSPEVVAAQLHAVLNDFPVHAIKIGMLATPATVHTVAARLRDFLGGKPQDDFFRDAVAMCRHQSHRFSLHAAALARA